MANKKDLRGSIEKMREVAQLLSEWASDLEQTVSDALQVARSSETSELPSGESRRLSLRNCDMEASLAKKGRKSADAAAEPVVTETPAAHPEAVPPESAAPPRQPVAEDVRALLAEKCAAGFRAQVQALINSYGAAKFSEVDPSHYAELMKSAALLGGDPDAG